MTTMDDVQQRAETQLQALEAVQARLDALTVTESGDGGRVIVDVDVTGAMTALRLLPGAVRAQPARLADAIVTTAVRAATRAFAERSEIMSAFVAEFAELTGFEPTGVSMEPNEAPVRPTLQETRTKAEGRR